MIKELITDEEFLKQPSAEATIEDASIAQDLIDTMECKRQNNRVYRLNPI